MTLKRVLNSLIGSKQACKLLSNSEVSSILFSDSNYTYEMNGLSLLLSFGDRLKNGNILISKGKII